MFSEEEPEDVEESVTCNGEAPTTGMLATVRMEGCMHGCEVLRCMGDCCLERVFMVLGAGGGAGYEMEPLRCVWHSNATQRAWRCDAS